MKYYFLVNALPTLSLGAPPVLSYEEVRPMLALNLSKSDHALVEQMQRLADLRNIRALWLGLPLDAKGNMGEKDLEESLLNSDPFPAFVGDFLDRYESVEDRLRYFSSLYSSFFAQSEEPTDSFLQKYFSFEREIRLCLAALRAKAAGRDLVYELQFEDATDPLVALLLAQKESGEVQLPQEYEDLKELFLDNGSDPKKLHRAIQEYRLAKIEEMETFQSFSIDQILSYLARLAIVEEWARMNEEEGRSALEQVCR